MVFKKGDKLIQHKKGCTCFRCSKVSWNKGKSGLPKHSEEHKKKISDKLKGRIMSKETRRKMSESRKGIKYSEETKRRISMSKQGVPNYKSRGKHLTEETKKQISMSKQGKKYPKEQYPNSGWRNKHPSEETKKKLRLKAIKYIEETCGGITPMIGHNEKGILDELELEYGYKIIRQYKVEGYFLDGYIREIKLAIEVDEKPKTTERDFNRQKQIEKKLNCKFLRIKDYTKRIR